MTEIFALFGVIAIMGLLLFYGYFAIRWLGDLIDKKKYKHKIAHRFDNPPTAKCYCRDCTMWDERNKHCVKFSCRIEDCNFCCFAEPREYEIVLLKENKE